MIKIWLDADSCPIQVRTVIIRASNREKLECTFVANRNIPFEQSDYVKMVVVEAGDGVADDYITEHIESGHIAVTRDIPLAARLLEKEAVVLNDRGEQFTQNNIKERLSLRDFMYEMRFTGVVDPGNKQFSPKEVQKFANCFDRELRKLLKAQEEVNDKT
ncbi:MAG: YaiI/YqxD family protein [Spirochaetales bacterium]|nr:YaiI/YqxD family protein [Spirochaetales bacterium]